MGDNCNNEGEWASDIQKPILGVFREQKREISKVDKRNNKDIYLPHVSLTSPAALEADTST